MKLNVEVELFTKIQEYAFELDIKPSESFNDRLV